MAIERKKTPKLRATAMDAVVVAIAPALIIGMIASLVFFLIIAFYRGEYDIRLMYILGLYSVAIVLIARIAIDSGRAYAALFSFPLAVVSLLAMFQFVQVQGPLGPFSWLVNLGLLAAVWYLADRITFDCTLVDEREESQQQGLLQSLGLLRRDAETTTTASRLKKSVLDSDRGRAKHNPGVWVLYFALLAFPLFGLGQLAIVDEAQRNRAFMFLVSYLACALSLLATTSFLGMRRYLRQKGLPMPSNMNRTWLLSAIVGVMVILVVCLILPLPGRNLGLVSLPIEFDSPDGLASSRMGWGNEGQQDDAPAANRSVESDQGPKTGAPQKDAQGNPQASDQAGDDAPGANGESGPKGSAGSAGEQSSKNDSNPSQQNGEKSGGQKSDSSGEDQSDTSSDDSSHEDANASQPADSADKPTASENSRDSNEQGASTPPRVEDQIGENSDSQSAGRPQQAMSFQLGALPEMVKWITMALLAAIVLIYILTHPREVMRLIQELRQFLLNLFGRKVRNRSDQAESTPTAQPIVASPKRPFSSYANPFAQNLQGWTPEQVIVHTFAAVEAWANEHGITRAVDQTAIEFVRSMERGKLRVDKHVQVAAELLDKLLFSGWKPIIQDVLPLAQLWKQLRPQ